MSDADRFMTQAIAFARDNVRKGGRPFGAVLVIDGEVVATGVNGVMETHDPTAHAELVAVRAAAIKRGTATLKGASVYASGHPCPMCLAAMRLAGITDISYAYSNEDGAPYGLTSAPLYAELRKPFADQQMTFSLGSMNSERSADLFDVIADPFQGALWSGPPFESAGWKSVTAGREPGSPAWLPRFRDSSVIRFTAQKNALDIPGAKWGPMRIVYLQYASDPVTFFDPHSFYREPDWMKQPRGPDVSPYLTWYPVVTMLQLALDMAMATASPMGYGHVYAPEHYIDAWVAVTDPQGLAPGDVERLKEMVSKRD